MVGKVTPVVVVVVVVVATVVGGETTGVTALATKEVETIGEVTAQTLKSLVLRKTDGKEIGEAQVPGNNKPETKVGGKIIEKEEVLRVRTDEMRGTAERGADRTEETKPRSRNGVRNI